MASCEGNELRYGTGVEMNAVMRVEMCGQATRQFLESAELAVKLGPHLSGSAKIRQDDVQPHAELPMLAAELRGLLRG